MNLLKPIRRFWRGQTRRMRVVYVMALILALLLAAFGVYSLVKPDETTDYTPKEFLFDAVDRDGIDKIVLHHANGKEFSVERYSYDVTLTTGETVTLTGFMLKQGEKSYSLLSLNDEAFAELVVGAGKHYVYDTVLRAPEPTDPSYDALRGRYEEKLSEYGLGKDAPYYELTTTAGKSYRVYYGKMSITGGTYYVRLEGRDAIYMTTGSSLGDLLNAEAPTSLLNAAFLSPTTHEYAYAYGNRFAITHFDRLNAEKLSLLTEGERTVTAADRVGYTALSDKGERVSMITLYPLGASLTSEVYREAFLGKALGECDFTFDIEEAGGDGQSTQKRTVRVVSIDYVDRGDTLFSTAFVNKSQRDLFHQYSIYKFTMDGLRSYLPDTDDILAALEGTNALTGSIVSLDFNAEAIEKYKLYAHMIEMHLPIFGEDIYRKDENGNDTEDLDPEGYTEDMLYVSDVTENGTRYVGSVLYGIVAEVSADSLSYLDRSLFDWVEPNMLNTSYERIESVRFDWHYSEQSKWLSSAYDFDIYYKDVKDEIDGSVSTVIDRIIAKGANGSLEIEEEIFRQLYYRMLYTRYSGEHSLSDDELALLLADEDACALSFTLTLDNHTEHTYRFIPISADRVLVSVESESGIRNASFVIYGSVFKAFARGYCCVMDGIPFDHKDKY